MSHCIATVGATFVLFSFCIGSDELWINAMAEAATHHNDITFHHSAVAISVILISVDIFHAHSYTALY